MVGGIPNLIFLHHTKTGGLTLRRMLKDRYGDAVYEPGLRAEDSERLRYVREEADSFPVAEESNASPLEPWRRLSTTEQEQIRVFVGHFWYGVHDDLPGRHQYVTILRHPVERVLSLYSHHRERGLTVPFERYLLTERDWEISNGQTRRIATSGLGEHVGDVTQAMFDVAAERLLDAFLVVGTTERFDETMLTLGHSLGWRSLAYQARNQSEQRLVRSQVSKALLERLAERNQFDRQLHSLASDVLDKNLVGIDAPAALLQLHRANRLLAYRGKMRVALGEASVLGRRATQAARRRFVR